MDRDPRCSLLGWPARGGRTGIKPYVLPNPATANAGWAAGTWHQAVAEQPHGNPNRMLVASGTDYVTYRRSTAPDWRLLTRIQTIHYSTVYCFRSAHETHEHDVRHHHQIPTSVRLRAGLQEGGGGIRQPFGLADHGTASLTLRLTHCVPLFGDACYLPCGDR